MTRPAVLARLNRRADRWLTGPEPRAAGRMGVFRIVYALFYLWYLATNPAETASGYQVLQSARVVLLEFLPDLSLTTLRILESGLVAALVLLAVGYRTTAATAVVLVLGVVLEAVSWRIDPEHSTVLLVAFIPLFMLVGGHWGDTYSLDALQRRNAGRGAVSPDDPDGRRFLGSRAVLVVLVSLFVSAGVSKFLPNSTWFTHPDLVANLILNFNVASVMNGLPANPAAGWIARTPVVHEGSRLAIPLFELSLLLALVNRTLRGLMVAIALVFHGMNALVLGVTFTPVLIAYAPFVDWQGLLDRLPRRLHLPLQHPTALAVGALATAVGLGWWWNAGDLPRRLVTLGGALDERSIWYAVLPLALGWLVVQLAAAARRLRRPDRSCLSLEADLAGRDR